MNPFRIDAPTEESLSCFNRDGYIAFPDAMTDTFREALIDEILSYNRINNFLSLSESERSQLTHPTHFFERPWNNRGPLSDALIDAPLIINLLQQTIETDYHFCHSAINLALAGAKRVPFHQDHHHWKHNNPVNISERNKFYIQILYYPNGFKHGDRSLCVIPGSHLVAPTPETTPEDLVSGKFDEDIGRKLEIVQLELPPGSFVYINARMFHGVDPKPVTSPQEYRIFLIDIFKQTGPPHRYTQEIPKEWTESANPYRKSLFNREPYTDNCWLN